MRHGTEGCGAAQASGHAAPGGSSDAGLGSCSGRAGETSGTVYGRVSSRGIGAVEGWVAVTCVVGSGVVLAVAASLFWLRSRRAMRAPRHEERGSEGPYRRPPDERVRRQSIRDHLRAMALVLGLVAGGSQIVYVGLYVELVSWQLGTGAPPEIQGDLFAFVLLVQATTLIGALASTRQALADHDRR